MGLIDFVKSAGEKLFGRKPKEESGPSAADLARQQAEALTNAVRSTGLEVQDLAISVNGDVAVVAGTVASQSEREKVVLVVGNTEGIGQVDDRLEVEEPAPEARFYTVVSGDTLSGIAKKHYGNAMKYPVIFEANRPMLQDPDKIYPGQVLRIPDLES